MNCWYVVCILTGTLNAGVLSLETKDAVCDRKGVFHCLSPIFKYQNITAAVFPYLTESRLREICQEYKVVDSCLSPLRATCTKDDEYYYLGVDVSFSFVCNETNIEVYLKHAKCLGETGLQDKGKNCLTNFYVNFYVHFSQDKVCSYVYTYLSCLKTAVKSACGEKAADWQYQVNTKHIISIIKTFGCKPGTTHLSTGVALAIALVVTFSITGTMSIILWVCRRRIIDGIDNFRAQRLQHYSSQRDDDVAWHGQSTNNHPENGYNQTESHYRIHHSAGTEESANHMTGIANQNYQADDNHSHVTDVTVDISHSTTTRQNTECHEQTTNEGFI